MRLSAVAPEVIDALRRLAQVKRDGEQQEEQRNHYRSENRQQHISHGWQEFNR